MPNDFAGGCFCGAVRYRVRGQPANSMVCHCNSCRRIAAAPVVAWVTFRVADFDVTRGRAAEFKSSPPVTRTFCAKCGTQLTYRHDDSPGTIDIATCSLDAPGAFPPTHHSWLIDNLPWIRFGDGLPAFDEWRPG